MQNFETLISERTKNEQLWRQLEGARCNQSATIAV